MLKRAVRSAILKTFHDHPRWSTKLLWVLKEARPDIPMVLDYAVSSKPRYGAGHPHQELNGIIAARSSVYADHLGRFLAMRDSLVSIPRSVPAGVAQPSWSNPYQPVLDAVSLYCFVASTNPRLYLEVGSGYSTSFVRQAIRDHHLRTEIVSIDPHPRAEIDAICDTVIRSPLEAADLMVFTRLQKDDVLFIDCSHRCFMNSDTTVLFLEVLPKLPAGVLVQIHDIFLPYDYPEKWAERYYGEQYLLACYLIAGWSKLTIVLPNYFITMHPELSRVLAPLWDEEVMHGLEHHGFGFWLATT